MSDDADDAVDGGQADDIDPEDVDFDVEPGEATGVQQTHLRAMAFWDDMIADMEATAAEYEDQGWETLELHPGDVATLAPGDDGPEFGLDVLVPDDEFAAVEDLLEGDVAFDSYEVYRATEEGLVLLVVAMEDHDAEVAVLYPAYYDVEGDQAMIQAAEDAGQMHTYVRTLQNERIEFTHDEPANFEPPVGAGGDEEA